MPLLRGCSARFQCRTAFRHEGGDHVIFVGAVEAFDHSDRPPLVFHGGRYALAVQKEAAPPAPQDGAEPDSSFSQDFLIYLLGRAHFQLFLSLRRDLEQHGLSEVQWFVLSILGVSDDRSVAELCSTLGKACGSSAMVLAMHYTQVACLVRHAADTRFFREYLRQLAGRQHLLASMTSENGTFGEMRTSLCAVRREGGRFRTR